MKNKNFIFLCSQKKKEKKTNQTDISNVLSIELELAIFSPL